MSKSHSKCFCGGKIVEQTSTTFAHPNMRVRLCERYFEGSRHFRHWIGGHECNEGYNVKSKTDKGYEKEWNSGKTITAAGLTHLQTTNSMLQSDINCLMEMVEGLQLTNADLRRERNHYESRVQQLSKANEEILRLGVKQTSYGMCKIITILFLVFFAMYYYKHYC